jgi:mRNA degradation ribonuclease J1/J2
MAAGGPPDPAFAGNTTREGASRTVDGSICFSVFVAKKLEPGKCCCHDNAALPFEISAHPVDHSLFGAAACILRGETTVAYTGDFRLHGKIEHATGEFVSKARDGRAYYSPLSKGCF